MASDRRLRPSKIDLLPEACESAVAWAAQELAKPGRTLREIYDEFVKQLEKVRDDLGLELDIPAFSSFGRHSIRVGNLRGRLNRSQQLANAIAQTTDGADADNLTRAVTLTLKTLIFEMADGAGEAGWEPKETLAMAAAVRHIQAAENMSAAQREKFEKEYAEKAKEAVSTVGKARGLTQETMDEINRRLGVV